MWQYDPYHNSIIAVGNGGTKPLQAVFTIFYNQGTQRYDVEQTLQPDAQMWIDLGKLIREKVPDKNGKTLPAGLTFGSYEFRDLTNKGVGALFEGKVIYDKTYGHVAYGCDTCCGHTQATVFFDPLLVPAGSSTGDGVNAYENCYQTWDDVSDLFYGNWNSGNTGIATVDYYGTHTGVSVGSTTSNTTGSLDGIQPRLCPQRRENPSGSDTVTPVITSIDPDLATVGTNVSSITINGSGFGSSPTVNPPSGVSWSGGQGSTDQRIVINNVAISVNAPIGPNSFTVTANGQTSNKGSFTLDGPFYMTVVLDQLGPCSGCTTAVRRLVTYQVMYFSGSVSPNIPLGESYTTTGMSCNIGYPGPGSCPETNTSQFTDQWTMGYDLTPAGCGYNIDDYWLWCTTGQSVGHLNGYIHTNAININGVVNPPDSFSPGTVINP